MFFSEAQGYAEKFRPYGAPSPQWLAWLAERFAARVQPHEPAASAER